MYLEELFDRLAGVSDAVRDRLATELPDLVLAILRFRLSWVGGSGPERIYSATLEVGTAAGPVVPLVHFFTETDLDDDRLARDTVKTIMEITDGSTSLDHARLVRAIEKNFDAARFEGIQPSVVERSLGVDRQPGGAGRLSAHVVDAGG